MSENTATPLGLSESTDQEVRGPGEAEGRFERTAPYLSAQQQEELGEEQRRIETMLSPKSPSYVRSQIQDRDMLNRNLRSIQRQLERDTPPPYTQGELDHAVKREQELREKLVGEMCTQEEMRRNPPGAVDKHRRFEHLHKKDVMEWKNIRRRLHASGDASTFDSRDVSNLEAYRPSGGPGQLSMDNAQIPGKQFYFPKGPIDVKHGLSDEEFERVQEEKRQMARRVAELEATVGKLTETIEKGAVKRGPGRPPKQPREE